MFHSNEDCAYLGATVSVHMCEVYFSPVKLSEKSIHTNRDNVYFFYHIYILQSVKTNFSIAENSKISINLSTSLFLMSTTISPSLYVFRRILFSSLKLAFATGREDGFCAGSYY